MSRTLSIIALLAIFILQGVSIREQKKEKGRTIVESNHFESATQKIANYNISDIKIGKPLVLLLKKDQKKSNLVSDFEISLQSKNIKVDCDFVKITDLCIIENTQDDKINMIIQCKVLPCKVSWVIYQPEIKSPTPNQIALNLFTLNESSRHLIGQITCNDPAVDSLDRDVTIYSDSPYKRIYKDNVLYVLFNNQKKGYVFVDINKKSVACSHISFKQPPIQLIPAQNITNDFVLKDSPAIYQLNSIPKSDFRFQCNSIRLDSIKQLKSSMSVTLFGLTGTQRKEIVKHDLMVSIKRADEFTIAFKKIEEKYEKLQIRFQASTNQIILLQSRLIVEDVQLLQLGQTLFFNLKKDEKINVKLVGNDAAQENKIIYVIPKRNDQLTLSKNSCPAKQDCQFTITAITDTQNMILISSFLTNATSIDTQGKGLYEFEQIQFIPIGKSQKHKITIGDHIFFNKQLKKHESIQVHINTPNALMYAACQSQCQVPDQRCRSRTGNYHHPFAFEAEQDCNFLINVQGLQNTVFQLTMIQNDQFILLQDGTPFSYTMDSKQERLDFKIKLQEKADVSFNLVSPLNSLKLLVSNSKNNLPDEDTSQQSTDGYILIQKDSIKGLQFIISVIKLKDFQSFFTHFSLVVSTKHQKLRLEPAVTNYQTLVAQSYRDFIFQFDPSESYILSFYAHNLKDQKIQLQVQVSDQQKKWDNAQIMTIEQQADYFDLDSISDTLCEQQGVVSCQIFLRITNKMSIEVDFTIILLMKNAIVELKDGIWQAFPQTYLTSTTNFYFYPRHQNENIFISYNTAVSHVRLTYRLWKYDQAEINPAQWPFPKQIEDKQQLNNQFKSHNYVLIDHQQMKQKCWPNCVLLVSLYINFQALLKQNINYASFEATYFQLMVSNNHAQLPQKQKMSLTLGKGEDKRIIIDLKYAINKQSLTFFTNTAIGQCPIFVDVYSQQHPKCPTNQNICDFIIPPGEDVYTLQFIKEKLKRKGGQDDQNVYLCLNIHSDTSCKISIQYSSQSQGFKKIHSDSFQEIELTNNQTKYYQIDTMTKQYAKITRISGFPFVLIKKCNKDQHKKCMQDFKSDPEKGKQIVVKTQSYEQEYCGDCIVLFKFSTIQPSKVNFHLQTGYSDLQLKENIILSDFANEGETNKYLINANAKQDLIVNIHIQEGELEAQITNLKNINLNKKSDSKNRIIHFVIKSFNDGQAGPTTTALINPLALSSDFIIYHITMKSLDPNKAISYSISYSSGKREVYLQDGVIFDYILETNKVSTFYYFNSITSSHVFYSLSMTNATTLNQLKIKSYYLQNPNDVTAKSEITLQRPTITKKTANPTILFSLPEHNFFMFQLTNPSRQQKISMAINHQQVILLPFDHQFPFQLHKKQEINILVDVNIPGYLDITIRKCDQTQPNFAYSFNYEGFIKGQFMYETVLNEQASSHQIVKANRIGTLYINFKASPQEDSTISIKVTHTQQKSKAPKVKAGKRGILTYQLTGDKNARVSIPAAECDQNQCKGIAYYYLSSTDEQLVYSQLICSSSFFSTAGFNSSAPLPLTKVQGKEVNKTVVFDFKMNAQTVFLGIKGVLPSGEQVYYQPTEVASLWGKWMQSTLLERCLMIFLVSLCLCVTIVFVRRASRKGYRPLDQS